LRDGTNRKVYNNISVSAVPLGWHVWPEDSEDEIYENVFVIAGAVPGSGQATNQFIRPIKLPENTKWSDHYDRNLYWNVNFPDSPNILKNKSMKEWKKEGYDLNSLIADPLFKDPRNGNYSVKENSPALSMGFKNFPMNEFGHRMTRMDPFGGDFSEEISVSLFPDARMNEGGSLRYTLDGSEPGIHSAEYSGPLKLKNSTLVKSRTFDANGLPIGFSCKAQFRKVRNLVYPSWFSSLLAGQYMGKRGKGPGDAMETEIHGALLVNIGEDPDLIDASGGYNSGCYIKSIDLDKGGIWLDAGLQKTWIIQKINDNNVSNIDDLKLLLKRYRGKTVTVTAVRNYFTSTFQIKI